MRISDWSSDVCSSDLGLAGVDVAGGSDWLGPEQLLEHRFPHRGWPGRNARRATQHLTPVPTQAARHDQWQGQAAGPRSWGSRPRRWLLVSTLLYDGGRPPWKRPSTQ